MNTSNLGLARRYKILKFFAVFWIVGVLSIFSVGVTTDCSAPPATPTSTYIEAGTGIANGVCTILEGVTSNQTIISICASVTEVAMVVAFITSLLRHGESVDAGNCTYILRTDVCASREEMGRAILFVIQQRKAAVSLDGGTTSSLGKVSL